MMKTMRNYWERYDRRWDIANADALKERLLLDPINGSHFYEIAFRF
jgi:hypothetical protein